LLHNLSFELFRLEADTRNLGGGVLSVTPGRRGSVELRLLALAVDATVSVIEGLALDGVLPVEMTLGDVFTHNRSITEIML